MKKSLLLLSLLTLYSLAACAAVAPVQDRLGMKIGQMIMVGFRGTALQETEGLREDITTRNLGGVVLFDYDVPTKSSGRNITSPDQVRKLTGELQQAASTPLFIAVDQEGGKVARLKEKYGFPETVSAWSLGKLRSPDSTYTAALNIAETLHKAGINVNFAPVADLNSNPENPVIGALDRSFSADPDVVSSLAEATIRALHTKKIIAALKHFPGHGSSTTDTHKDFTDVTGTWDTAELAPYRRLIAGGYSDLVMTAHVYNANLDPIYPATLSKHFITGLLRDSLGFRGAVISDDMQMKAVTDHYSLEEAVFQALDAGVDILLFANNSSYEPDIMKKAVSIIRSLVDKGKISSARIDSSYRRITTLKQHYLNASP